MTDSTTIWHNPRCSKSRQTLALLEARGGELNVREYMDDMPTIAELKDVMAKLGFTSAHEWLRKNEADYRELGLKAIEDEEVLLDAMTKYPRLIERPVVIHGDKAMIGRPPEQVLELF
ncbi:arsenate reductase (glutaredoxin) [Maricaulis sp.]|uniref:arsenate reductase (glutaredoxin) n=1 Tax=unclassified Maricaulis TaxID=2632371 RepID=UPI001B1C9173|nr:arsenate reductase (glutaredoxin) [Maricaulis sp.]MBO6795859.1 arsenate reductase (glutaredoxin) [Maricaulis sp.]